MSPKTKRPASSKPFQATSNGPQVSWSVNLGCAVHQLAGRLERTSYPRTPPRGGNPVMEVGHRGSWLLSGSERVEVWACTAGWRPWMRGVPRQNYDRLSNQVHKPGIQFGSFTCKTGLMLRPLRLILVLYSRFFYSHRAMVLENLALRQQLGVLQRRRPQPRFGISDKFFWVILRRLWRGWNRALILIQPETVVRWHRAGFKLYWRWLSRHRTPVGRKCVSRELRELILRMVAENPTWGAPRIHGELKMLGFDTSERTVLRWMRRVPRSPEPAKRWMTFLSNHREGIAAMDFFTVPTVTFGVLYCFFVIAHDRRRILHFNVTRHPASSWVVQQLREAFPYDSAPGYLIFDRGANFNQEVIDTVKNFGTQPKRTSFRSPWQNGVAERFVGNCRRDLLDHVIVLNERHLKRLMNEHILYYHEDRTHLALGKGTPAEIGRA